MTTTTTYTGMDPSGRSSSRFVGGKVSCPQEVACSFTIPASLDSGLPSPENPPFSPGRDRAAKRPGFRGGASCSRDALNSRAGREAEEKPPPTPPPANPGWDFFSCREGLPSLGSGGPADNASHRHPLAAGGETKGRRGYCHAGAPACRHTPGASICWVGDTRAASPCYPSGSRAGEVLTAPCFRLGLGTPPIRWFSRPLCRFR